jgi:hypothetical protein
MVSSPWYAKLQLLFVLQLAYFSFASKIEIIGQSVQTEWAALW